MILTKNHGLIIYTKILCNIPHHSSIFHLNLTCFNIKHHANPSEVGSSLLEVLVPSGVWPWSLRGLEGTGRGGHQLLREVRRLAEITNLVGEQRADCLGHRSLVGETVLGLETNHGHRGKPSYHVLGPRGRGRISFVNTCPPYSCCDQQGENKRTSW